MIKTTLFLICTIFSLTSCSAQLKKGAFSVKEGITGKVIWKQGNHMPSPDRVNKSNGKGVKKELYIFKPINVARVIQKNSFFEINETPVAKTESTENGFFEISLPPGKYSVFTKEEQGFFANRFDGDGNINVVEVMPGKPAYLLITIDYKASY